MSTDRTRRNHRADVLGFLGGVAIGLLIIAVAYVAVHGLPL